VSVTLLQRYVEVFQHAWRIRREFDSHPRRSYEAEFLPAHLEILETPIHPAPLWAARAIGALAAVIALVAIFGHLDIVAVAHGKLVPNARVKIIQPAFTGVVRSILVHNGTHVTAGQLLLELDPTQATADADKASVARLDAQLAGARERRLNGSSRHKPMQPDSTTNISTSSPRHAPCSRAGKRS
jgi:hemolysin D